MSWKHPYDDYFEGISIDDRDIHYQSEEIEDQIKINFYVQNPNEISDNPQIGMMNFYVYKQEKEIYDQKKNLNTKKLFEKQGLLITPIEELEQLVFEQRMSKIAEMEQERQQEVQEDEIQLKRAENIKDRQLWVDKYMPKKFEELLSQDKTNREVLCWLKAWDPIVFKKKLRKNRLSTPYTPSYGKNMFGQSFNRNGNNQNNQNNNGNQFTSSYGGFSNKNQGNQQGANQTNQQGNNNNNNNNNNNQFFQQKPFFFDLTDDYSVQKMQNSVILLAGPPGSGKTTLARIVAAHCGYKSIEINASEDRTAAKLIERIETMTRNEAIQFKNGEGDQQPKEKPSLIIIDEVDGALESESHGAVNHLLDFIFKGEKNLQNKPTGGAPSKIINKNQAANKKPDSKQKKKKDEDDDGDDEDNENKKDDFNMEEETNKGPNTQNVHIRRPVIFICNDVYSKGLRELRKRALVFNFTKARSDSLIVRLREICQQEKLYVDQLGLQKICDHNENDIRSTLMNLQMVSKLQKKDQRQKITIDQILMEEKNNTKGILELLEVVMMPSANRKDPNIEYTIQTLVKNTQPDVLIDTTLLNYHKLRSSERSFEKIPQFLTDLSFAEILESNLLKHNYEMTKFISIPLINFGLNLKNNERIKLDYPRDNFQLKRRNKAAIDCVESLLENLPHQDAPFLNKKMFVLEYLTYLYQIIQPNIQSTMIGDNEKKDLFTSLSIMIDFSIKLLDHPQKMDRNGQKFTIYFTPYIERMLMFGMFNQYLFLICLQQNAFPEQRLNERSIHFILKNYEIINHQKQLTKDLADDDIQQKKLEQQLMNIQMLDNQYNKKIVKRKQRVEGEDASFLYKFREGVSIPIKYDVKMEQFFM